ncbi:MAG: hypothetical protein U0Q16_16165 [Bryobacteraceae bacterium]
MKHLILAAAPAVLLAASPQSWELTSYQDFLKGRFSGIALSKDGRMRLAPKLDVLAGDAEPAVWSVARASDGTVYFGTGHKGKLYRMTPGGKAEAIFSASEAEIFAVAVDGAGRVYAGTSPNGKIYRVEGGKASEYFAPGAQYIWSLAVGSDGALYAGTGGEGKVFRITAAGKGEVWYDTGQGHVTALLLDEQGRLLAGTEPNGILYRVTAKDKAFVLYDANLPEIRALALGPDGSIYAAAMGGSIAKATAAAGAAAAASSTISVTATSTSITVTDQSAQPQADQPKPAAPAATPAGQPAAASAPVTEVAGVEKSAVYWIHADNTVDTLFSSKEENVYDIAVTPTGLLLATDNQGRIYWLDRTRKSSLLVETKDNEAVRLLGAPGGVLVAAANPGKLYRLAAETVGTGTYESGVHDATTASRWGKLSWRARPCSGCGVSFRTRSGNSAVPDKTWSDWSAPLGDAAGTAVASPGARFVQWKAELTGAGGQSPELDSVRLAYLPQNLAPAMKSVTVSAATASAGAKPAATAGAAATPTYSITVTDTGEAGASSATGTATQPLTRASAEQIVISWLAEDLDGDKLLYSVFVRGENESEWKPIKRDMTETLATIDAEALADGRYWFRVTVSDRLANPAPYAREDEMTSAPILVDRTPPAVTLSQPTRSGGGVEIRVEAKDATSPLKSAEYSIDAGAWMPLAAADGVVDSEAESFVLRLDPAPAGEHTVVVRAVDAANNAGLAKLVLR